MPRVYDKGGRELTVGADCQHIWDLIRVWRVEEIASDGVLIVERAGRGPLRLRADVTRSLLPRKRRRRVAPDLLLIDSPTEGKEG